MRGDEWWKGRYRRKTKKKDGGNGSSFCCATASPKSAPKRKLTKTEGNIHGGVKYIRFIIDRYYKSEPMDDLNKGLFAFAAYNCGPGRVRQLRRDAAARGLDANVWFDNVERVAAEKIGRETVTYVSNIFKYYVSYLLVQGEYINRRNARKTSPGS